ncbi:pseudouridine synthase [Dysgonomonas sp. 216]|uniref:pseudouridine synthase n=1 Tax=Dysgonomonas sp. 216 TaxID=2302934 RepID=UPI0013D44666|nr:pseudouridine synthase [Dysgonomonas sp. 216]NDW17404.1 pseudouridine synthase [Dysgonomonas sp. 216]
MITNRDDFRSQRGSESRDGNSSSGTGKTQDGARKKRPRVGDTRISTGRVGSSNNDSRRSSNSGNSDTREYRSNNNSGYRDGNSSGGYRDNNGERRSNSGNSSYNRRGNSNNRQGGGYGNSNRQQGGGYNNNRRQPSVNADGTPRKVFNRQKSLVKPVKYKENIDPNTPLRLNKYLANAGVCSRREADTYISSGVVKVNGVVVSELGAKVTRGDIVTFHDQPVTLESKIYVLLNKPKNTVTTSDDPQNRKTVMDLVKNACSERIYPVGRLDRNTTGVLLLTNDGDLASKLMHPKFKKKKIYQVKLDRDVAIEDMQTIADGVDLDDGEIHADSIAYVAEDVLDEVGIEIHSGRNRVVRRIFEKLGYQVMKLDRVYFAGLTKKNLPRGRWRYLTESEVNMLRMGAYE